MNKLLITKSVLIAFAALSAHGSQSTISSYANSGPVTFNKEIVRIFQQKCTNCHHAGTVAPFELMTYQDAIVRRNSIKREVIAKTMPPWSAAKGCNEYANDRSLTDDEIRTIVRWVDEGAIEGDPNDLPPQQQFSTGWQLGQPSAIYKNEEPYEVPSGKGDLYRCFVMKDEFPNDVYTNGIETLPGNNKIVHHVIMYIDPSGTEAIEKDKNDPGPGYTCFGGSGVKNEKMLGGWAPGYVPMKMYPGYSMTIPKGSRLVLQVHYSNNTGMPQMDQTQVGLHFLNGPTPHTMRIDLFQNTAFTIPAGNKNYEVRSETTLTRSTLVPSVMPHMHMIGKEAWMEAVFPNGTSQCLVHIDRWDFHWQNYYIFNRFPLLPPGTIIKGRCIYDNSAENFRNPNNPPQDVSWGDATKDEMCSFFFSAVDF